MATDPRYEPITVEQFLEMDFGTDRKFELVGGVIQMMTGGSFEHAHVAGNIYLALRMKLRGTGCCPFNSDMGVRVGDGSVRYPDISIVCRKDWLAEPSTKIFDDPLVIFEVLSPSTTSFDQGTKFEEYRQVPGLDTIVFVDPVNRLTRVSRRLERNSWLLGSFAKPHDVTLPELGITLTEDEIFARP